MLIYGREEKSAEEAGSRAENFSKWDRKLNKILDKD